LQEILARDLSNSQLNSTERKQLNSNQIEVKRNGSSNNANMANAVAQFNTHPYEGDIDLSTSAGQKLWSRATEIASSVERITLNVQNADEFVRAIKAKITSTGVPTGVAGDLSHVFGDKLKLIEQHNQISLEQIKALACYNWGGANQQRVFTELLTAVPLPAQMSLLDPTNDVDAATFSRLSAKQQYRVCAEMLAEMIASILTVKSYEFCLVEKADFTFEEPDGEERIDGLVLLWKIMNNIRPTVVIDLEELEEKLKSAT
jgi:hypothetical protein